MPRKNLKLRRKYDREYYQLHKEERLKYRHSHKEKDRENWRNWAKKNHKRRMEHLKKYKEKNPDYARAYKKPYTKIAFRNLPKRCNRCGSFKDLQVHHKDKNHCNNIVGNLEFLCRNCHIKQHRNPFLPQK